MRRSGAGAPCSPGPPPTSISSDCLEVEPCVTPAPTGREKMARYCGVTRLQAGDATLDSSELDCSALDSTSHTQSVQLTPAHTSLNVSVGDMRDPAATTTSLNTHAYYTIDSRRLATKHKKSQHDR